METPIKMDDLGGPTPIFGNTHVVFCCSLLRRITSLGWLVKLEKFVFHLFGQRAIQEVCVTCAQIGFLHSLRGFVSVTESSSASEAPKRIGVGRCQLWGNLSFSLKGSGNILPVSNSQVSLSNGFHWKAYSSLAARVHGTVLVSLTIDELRAKSHGPVISSPYLFIDVQCQSLVFRDHQDVFEALFPKLGGP